MIVKIKHIENPNGNILGIECINTKGNKNYMIVLSYYSQTIVTYEVHRNLKEIYFMLPSKEQNELHMFTRYNYKMLKLNLIKPNVRDIRLDSSHSLSEKMCYRNIFMRDWNEHISTKI